MSSSEHQHPSQPNTAENVTPTGTSIETVYTTVESQADRTDWLTVVSNLRQINRQLVEQIARLEQALASAKQELHNHKEQNQSHEITILQQQDELRIARDRVGALFQQLENSHQIGQRQQTLIETISQQLEISQTIIPQLEAENEELNRQYQQQSQKLIHTEQIAAELNRRLQVPAPTTNPPAISATNARPQSDPAAVQLTPAQAEMTPTQSVDDPQILPSIAATLLVTNPKPAHPETLVKLPSLANPEPNILDVFLLDEEDEPTAGLDERDPSATLASPVAPRQPIYLPTPEIPAWTPSDERLAPTLNPASPKLSSQSSWRESITSNQARHHADFTPDVRPNSTPTPPEEISLDNAEDDKKTSKPSPNWPAPTVNPTRPTTKTVTIDLPKFPTNGKKT